MNSLERLKVYGTSASKIYFLMVVLVIWPFGQTRRNMANNSYVKKKKKKNRTIICRKTILILRLLQQDLLRGRAIFI